MVQRRDSLFTGDYIRSVSDLHPDGDRVLVPPGAESPNLGGVARPAERFMVVVNWFEELRQRVGN